MNAVFVVVQPGFVPGKSTPQPMDTSESRKKARDEPGQTAADKELQLAKLEEQKLKLQQELLEAQLREVTQKQERIRNLLPEEQKEVFSDLGAPYAKLAERRRQEKQAADASARARESPSASEDDGVGNLWRECVRPGKGGSTSSTAPAEPKDRGAPPPPRCPDCNSFMQIKRNTTRGNHFWGCPGFPHCEGTRPLGYAEAAAFKSGKGVGASSAAAAARDGAGESASSKKEQEQEARMALRRKIYDEACERGELKVSAMAKYNPQKVREQVQCQHPFETLLWGGNAHAAYARCGNCDLENCIYTNRPKKVFMTDQDQEDTDSDDDNGVDDVSGVHLVVMEAGWAMVDTGCRAGVGGDTWHQEMKKELERLGKADQIQVVKKEQIFKFGDGVEKISKQTFIYPVGIDGVESTVRMALVPGGSAPLEAKNGL